MNREIRLVKRLIFMLWKINPEISAGFGRIVAVTGNQEIKSRKTSKTDDGFLNSRGCVL